MIARYTVGHFFPFGIGAGTTFFHTAQAVPFGRKIHPAGALFGRAVHQGSALRRRARARGSGRIRQHLGGRRSTRKGGAGRIDLQIHGGRFRRYVTDGRIRRGFFVQARRRDIRQFQRIQRHLACNGAGEVHPRPFVLRFGLDSRHIVAGRQQHAGIVTAVPRIKFNNLGVAFGAFHAFAHARLPIHQRADQSGIYVSRSDIPRIIIRITIIQIISIGRIKNGHTHIGVFAQAIRKGVRLRGHGSNIPHHGRRAAHGVHVGHVHLYRNLVHARIGNRRVKFNFIGDDVIAGSIRRHRGAEGIIPVGLAKFAADFIRAVPRRAERNGLVGGRPVVVKNDVVAAVVFAVSALSRGQFAAALTGSLIICS